MNRRAAGVAVALVAAGLAVRATPSLGSDALAALGRAGTTALALALGGATLVGSVALARRAPAVASLPPSEAGPRPADRTVGADLDAALERVGDPDATADRAAIRERLRAATVRALVRRGTDSDTARARLDRGTWTDDPVAAAFLGDGGPGRRERLREALSTRPPFVRRAGRAARELDRLREGDR